MQTARPGQNSNVITNPAPGRFRISGERLQDRRRRQPRHVVAARADNLGHKCTLYSRDPGTKQHIMVQVLWLLLGVVASQPMLGPYETARTTLSNPVVDGTNQHVMVTYPTGTVDEVVRNRGAYVAQSGL